MAKLIIEERNQTSKVKIYHKVDSFPVTIGRGYENTLILDDPYVSDIHLRVEEGENEGEWRVSDCQSNNGSFLADGRPIAEETVISSGDHVSIGDSHFSFYAQNHPVAAPLKWHPVPSWIKLVGKPVIAWGVFLFFLAFVMTSQYLETYEEFEPSQFIMMVIGVLIIVLIWVGIWSLVGRVATHTAGFHRQLSIVLLMMLFTELGETVVEYIEFFSSNRLLGFVLNYGLSTLVLAVTLFYCLGVATNMIKQKRMIASAIVAVLMFGMTAVGEVSGISKGSGFKSDFSYMIKPVPAVLLPINESELFWKENLQLTDKEN